MDVGSIILSSISCKGVKYFTLFQKPSVYADVSITGGKDGQQQKHKTSVDHNGGENPEWDQTMKFDLDHKDFQPQDLFLEFRIKAQGNLLLGDKLIGKSRILMADLVEGQPFGAVRHVSYRVQSSDGKPNGVLSFSYKLNLPDSEIRPSSLLDPVIPSLTLHDSAMNPNYYPPPSAPDSFSTLPASAHRQSLYPALPLPEPAPADIFYYHNQPSPPDLANYYNPPPPPAPAHGYYPPSDRAVYRDPGYVSGNLFANSECYFPPPAALPWLPPTLPPTSSFGTYPPWAPGYSHPPPQDSFGYCNSYMKISNYEEELMPKANLNVVQTHKYIDDTSVNNANVCDHVRPFYRHTA